MSLQSSISRIRRLQRLGRWCSALIATAAIVALLALTAGLLDAWLAFESPARTTLVTTLIIIASLAALSFLVIATRFSLARSASTADRLLTSSRNLATAASSLPKSAETPLSEFLASRSREMAASEISALPAGKIIPWKQIRLTAIILFFAALPIAILALAHPEATSTIAKRLLNPSQDLPPWSKLRFKIEPSKLAAVYGGELPLAVEISGDALKHPVELLVRRPGNSKIQRLPSFRESETRFSRNLDSLTEQVSIAFASGKARSHWYPVELLLQPKILSGETNITPPLYTERPAYSAPLDTNEINVLEGSEILLSLTSNRPLATSPLIFTPAAVPGTTPVPVEIPGELSATHTISYRFIATSPGTLSALLKDVRGTPAATPLELQIKAVPDQAPAVDLTSPPRFLLATPSSILKINGRAEDDFSLSKVRVVRTLEGFRDRARTVAPALRDKAYEFADQIPLSVLGVSPGQVIELFLEASDHNPSLLGQGSSEISRIQIITEEDYAERIRAKTTLDEFNARYQAIAQALKQSRESLEKMSEAAKANDAEASEEARKAAEEAHKQAAEMLDQLAEDFPAFEMEKRLKEIAKKAAADAKANQNQLKNFDPKASPEDQEKAIQEMLDRLGANEKEQQDLQKDAELMAEAGKILEMAAKFQQIYQTQVSITKRILTIAEEIHKGNNQNRRLLASLADTQEKNREALDEFDKELQKRLDAITRPELLDMSVSGQEFLDALRMADPQSVMDLGTEYGRQGAAEDAYVQAELARALLENLMQKDSPFPSACQGQCMKFSVKFPDVNQTMAQLLEGLMCQNPGMSPNQGMGGGGMGGGGSGPSGNAAPGFSMPDVPVLGPNRMEFEPASLGGTTDGKGASPKNNPLLQAAETEKMSPTEIPIETKQAPDPQSIPEPYRDAVKKYFTP